MQWWERHRERFVGLCTQEEQLILEDLTGRLPILLNRLLESTTPTINPTAPEDMQRNGFQQLLTALWGAPEVVDMIENIIEFAENMWEKFGESPRLVR